MRQARETQRTTRAVTRRAPRSGEGRRAAIAARTKVSGVPARCRGCGAVYAGKTWRAGRERARAAIGAHTSLCPACAQVAAGEYFGRVRIVGPLTAEREREIRRRIQSVEARARFTQPERRTARIDRTPPGLEVTTTSEKLAHRIARELEKAFGGRARYRWTDGKGQLEAAWDPADAVRPRRHRRRPKRG